MIDIRGQRFGYLTAIKSVGHLYGQAAWLCQCDCGNTTIAASQNLRMGRTRSCGCGEVANRIKHGDSTRTNTSGLYHTWRSMKARCENHKHKSYHRYGGRGIIICSPWKTYIGFRAWGLRAGWEPGLTIDRIDNDKSYYPSNCRWVTRKHNARKGDR